jgi:ribosomal protein S18 acetylase RimI-like enzyme
MFPLTIIQVQDEKELFLLTEFMKTQPQYYPNYLDWVYGKCKTRIEEDRYKTLVPIFNGKAIGDIIYQNIGKYNIEIKNFRIDPKYQNKDLGHFLLNQIFNKKKNILLDVSTNNFKGVEFFIHNGFKITRQANLYLPNQSEYEMSYIKQ